MFLRLGRNPVLAETSLDVMNDVTRQIPMLAARIPWSVLFGANRLRFFDAVREAAPPNNLFRMRFGTRNVILLYAAEAAGDVLLTRAGDYTKGVELSKYLRPMLGNGLLGSEGTFHKKQRQTILPVFTPARIAQYAPGIANATGEMVSRWDDGETVDFHREMTRLTLRIVGETLFGVRGLGGNADELGGAITTAMGYFIRVLRSPIRSPFAGVPFWRPDVRRAIATLNRAVYGLIAERRRAGATGNDLLSLLLNARDEAGEPMPDAQVRDEVMTFFLAGHETTANALAWTFYLLARHPEEHARVESEARAVLGGRPATYADIEKLPRTLVAIKEAMRLYPPAFAFTRRARVDTELLDYHVPAGSAIILNVYLMHRDAHYFPDPDVFDPSRFSPDAEKTRPRFAYLPFGGGHRVCIGAAFALMEMQIVVATVLSRVGVSVDDGEMAQEVETLITLRPKGSMALRVRRHA